MRVSLSWVREWLPPLKVTPSVLKRRLTAAGIEVEAERREREGLEGIVVGEIVELDAHPDADALKVARVFDGGATHTVVCGAPNAKAGQRAAFAPAGTVLPSGLRIEVRSVRGVESAGMLCSEAELGLSLDASGILVLKARARPGRALADVLGLDDIYFDLGITPNRPDLLSHYGLAREVAALFGVVPIRPALRLREVGPAAGGFAQIEVKSERCRRYVARVVSGVRVGPSPEWVRRRLHGLGLRSISNVVDATNFALLELGHPLHAFDLDTLGKGRIRVRLAGEGERLTTLDGADRALSADDLVIADEVAPVALAGVMGGRATEVSEATTRVLLEAAIFDPMTVRRSAKRHALHSEASHRFERGADPKMLEAAIDRCAELILEWAGGQVCRGRLSVGGAPSPRIVPIRPERAQLVLGRPVGPKEVRATLKALGLRALRNVPPAPSVKSEPSGASRRIRGRGRAKAANAAPPPGALLFEIPSHRVDLNREEDLIEEVARLLGYDTIPASMPRVVPPMMTTRSSSAPDRQIRAALVQAGFLEAISLAFQSARHASWLGMSGERPVVVENPLGEESQWMRLSLLPGLLRAVRLNQDHLPSITDLRLFEVGKVFRWGSRTDELPVEEDRATFVLRGRRSPPSWAASAELTDVYDAKAVVEGALAVFRIGDVDFSPDDSPWLHPVSATLVQHRGRLLGRFGEVHPDVCMRFGIEGPPVWAADLDVAALAALATGPAAFAPMPRFPPAQRDLSFYLGREVSGARILSAVREAGGRTLEWAEIFDVYAGQGVPEGRRSVAIALTLRAPDRTLTDREVDETEGAIVTAVAALGGQLRASAR